MNTKHTMDNLEWKFLRRLRFDLWFVSHNDQEEEDRLQKIADFEAGRLVQMDFVTEHQLVMGLELGVQLELVACMDLVIQMNLVMEMTLVNRMNLVMDTNPVIRTCLEQMDYFALALISLTISIGGSLVSG